MMRHSVIIKVGENYHYKYSETAYPNAPQGTYEFNRSIIEFQYTVKTLPMKSEDAEVYVKTKPEYEQFKLRDRGLDIDYNDIEFYDEGGKTYARYNKGNTKVKTITQSTQVGTSNTFMAKVEPVLNVPYTPQNVYNEQNNKFYFDIIIDEQTGEPVVQFNFDNYAETTEKKLLKSFIIKSAKFGIELSKVDGSTHTISIKN